MTNTRFTRVLQYLGLAAVPPQDGYTLPDRRFPRQQVCSECGAVVPPSRQDQHTRWHLQHG